jgi:hypothetical protein
MEISGSISSFNDIDIVILVELFSTPTMPPPPILPYPPMLLHNSIISLYISELFKALEKHASALLQSCKRNNMPKQPH